MREKETPRHDIESASEKLRCNLGAVAGKKPFGSRVSQDQWDELPRATKTFMRRYHKKGKAGFSVIPSAEAPGPVFRDDKGDGSS